VRGRKKPEKVLSSSRIAPANQIIQEVDVTPIDLASEMAAARERREKKTAQLLREARAQAIRAAVRPGSSRAVVEEKALSFYPRLSPELIEEAVSMVCPDPPAPREAAVPAAATPPPMPEPAA
jgi:hypothetical protein